MCSLIFLIVALLVFFSFALNQDTFNYEVGCFSEDDLPLNFSFKSTNKSSSQTVDACVLECKQHSFKYAALYERIDCFCGDAFGGSISNSCNYECLNNSTQICGGDKSASVYETLHGVLGSPGYLILLGSESDSLHISWADPVGDMSKILEYRVTAEPVYSFSEELQPHSMEWDFSSHTHTAKLYGLHPGTKYTVKVQATSVEGLGYPRSITAWTAVGTPDTPLTPEILSRTSTSIIVKISPVIARNGPITAYQVVVVDETVPVILQYESLSDFYNASKNALPFYIAAEFLPNNLMTVFTVGDGKYYGKYYNAPLQANIDYHILLGVISTINETKVSFSPSVHSQHESSDLNLDDYNVDESESYIDEPNIPDEHSSTSLLILSIAIGVFGFILFLLIIAYIALRILHKRRTRSPENQELTVNSQNVFYEPENGYAIGAHYIDDEGLPIDHYKNLKEKVWIIPHYCLSIVGDTGIGKFGEVKKGLLTMKDGRQVTCLVHSIEDNALSTDAKKQMLLEFSAHINIGLHKNVISILGLMEELNVISVAFEYESAILKGQLIESRAVQHYPVYADKNRRFSTLPEKQVLEILAGIARGMNYLFSLNIAHGQLCSRNITMVDGVKPKVSGFGLIHFHNEVYIPDYRRWHSLETLRAKICLPKSDIWSFGILMWEILTLGGTPFSDIQNEDLSARIIRGLRLPQLQYFDDDVYQIMLDCWQTDPDERPSFEHLEEMMLKLANDEIAPHILFSLYQSFQYEVYLPHLEFQ